MDAPNAVFSGEGLVFVLTFDVIMSFPNAALR